MPELSGKLSLDGSQYNRTMTDAEKQTAALNRQVNEANRTLNNLQRQANSATSSIANLFRSFKSGDIGGIVNSVQNASASLSALSKNGAGAGSSLMALGRGAIGSAGPLIAVAAAVTGVVSVVGSAIRETEKFKNSINGFSALTGMTGGVLMDVGNSAKDMSDKFGMAATEIIDSMSKIGSQAPQLLADKDALAEVTEAAIVLQRAADGISLDEAAGALTAVMNQMGVEASEANNIINTLAAGSQKGAADINYLNQAIMKSGAQAHEAGMSYQQLVGAIETIAPKFGSAEVAGTALNTLLIRLQTQSESKFNPAIVGMEQALENLANANLTAEQKVKLFGQSALLAGNTLIAARKEYMNMTEAVTGTSTAFDQAKTKGDTIENGWNKMKAAWSNLMVSLGETATIQGMIYMFKTLIGWITKFISGIRKALDAWNKFTRGTKQKVEDTKQEITQKVNVEVHDEELSKLDKVDTNKTKTVKAKIDYDKGSLEDYEKQLQVLEDSLKKKKLSILDVDKTNKQIESVKTKIENMKVFLNLEPAPNSLAGLQKRISEQEDKISKLDANIPVQYDEILKAQDELEKLQKQYEDTKAKIEGVVKVSTKFKSEGDEGSIQYAEDKVSYYTQKLRLEVEGSDKYNEYLQNLKEWTQKRKEIQIKFDADTSDIPPETQEWLSKEISKREAELRVTAIGTPEYDKIIKEIQELSKQDKEIKLKVDLDKSGAKKGSSKWLDTNIADVKAKLDLQVYGTDEYNKLSKELKELEKEKHEIDFKVNVDDMGFFDWKDQITDTLGSFDAVYGAFDNLKNKMEEGANGWEIFMAGVQAVSTTLDSLGTVIETVNMVMSLLKGTTQATTAAETTQAAATTSNAAQQVAASAAVTSAKSSEAVAGAAASGAKWPWPINLIAIAASIAAVLGILAMVGSFANGGIISGKTTMGDMNIARVNSGEMILNTRQQNNLFKAIDQNRLGGNGNANISGDVVVRGSKMHLLLKNYNKTKVGKDIGIK